MPGKTKANAGLCARFKERPAEIETDWPHIEASGMNRSVFPRRYALLAVYSASIVLLIWAADIGALRGVYSFIDCFRGSDKIGHILLVGGLAWFLNKSLLWRRMTGGLLLGSVFVAIGFTAEEVSQAWIPSRHFDLLDLAANLTGVAIASNASVFCGSRK